MCMYTTKVFQMQVGAPRYHENKRKNARKQRKQKLIKINAKKVVSDFSGKKNVNLDVLILLIDHAQVCVKTMALLSEETRA